MTTFELRHDEFSRLLGDRRGSHGYPDSQPARGLWAAVGMTVVLDRETALAWSGTLPASAGSLAEILVGLLLAPDIPGADSPRLIDYKLLGDHTYRLCVGVHITDLDRVIRHTAENPSTAGLAADPDTPSPDPAAAAVRHAFYETHVAPAGPDTGVRYVRCALQDILLFSDPARTIRYDAGEISAL